MTSSFYLVFLLVFLDNASAYLGRWSTSIARISSRETLTLWTQNDHDASSPSLKQGKTPLYTWDERLQQLQEFSQEHGHLLVPRRYPNLGLFVSRQRQLYKKHLAGQSTSLTDERIAQLNELGFCWDASLFQGGGLNGMYSRTTDWKSIASLADLDNKMLRELSDWKDSHHVERTSYDCPWKEMPANAPARKWLQRQRRIYALHQSSASESHSTRPLFEALATLDPHWHWSTRERQWHRHVHDLKDYKREYGDCLVPINYEANRSLAFWVNNVRAQHRKNMLPLDRVEQLNRLGFCWDRWEMQFETKQKSWNVAYGDEESGRPRLPVYRRID